MGLISRVSSRTYRLNFGRRHNLRSWRVKTSVIWERRELINSSRSKRTRPTTNVSNLSSAVVKKVKPITKHVVVFAFNTRTNLTHQNIVLSSVLPTAMLFAKSHTLVWPVTLSLPPLTLTNSQNSVAKSVLKTTPLTTALVSSWPVVYWLNSTSTKPTSDKLKSMVTSTTLNQTMMVQVHSDVS